MDEKTVLYCVAALVIKKISFIAPPLRCHREATTEIIRTKWFSKYSFSQKCTIVALFKWVGAFQKRKNVRPEANVARLFCL